MVPISRASNPLLEAKTSFNKLLKERMVRFNKSNLAQLLFKITERPSHKRML